MTRDWGIKDKVTVVLGASPLANAVRGVLAREGATMAEAADAATEILVSVPATLNNALPLPVDVDDETWHEQMDSLFDAPRRATHAVLAGMMDRGAGRIVHLIGSFEPMTFSGEFAAWGAMAAWSKSLTRSIGKSGPTMNLIQAGQFDGDSTSHIPAGRFCTADDVASLVVFLCSPYARYLTGTVIPLDGGMRRYQN